MHWALYMWVANKIIKRLRSLNRLTLDNQPWTTPNIQMLLHASEWWPCSYDCQIISELLFAWKLSQSSVNSFHLLKLSPFNASLGKTELERVFDLSLHAYASVLNVSPYVSISLTLIVNEKLIVTWKLRHSKRKFLTSRTVSTNEQITNSDKRFCQ